MGRCLFRASCCRGRSLRSGPRLRAVAPTAWSDDLRRAVAAQNPPESKTRRTTFSDSSKSTGLEIVIPQRQTDMFYQFSARPRFLRSQHSMQTSFIARMLHEFIGAPAHHQLRELGWTEEQNLRIDICWGAADLDRARSCAAKLVNLAFACWSCTTPTTSQVLAMYASSRP